MSKCESASTLGFKNLADIVLTDCFNIYIFWWETHIYGSEKSKMPEKPPGVLTSIYKS